MTGRASPVSSGASTALPGPRMTDSGYDIPTWISEHRERTWSWFQTIQVPEHPAWIRLCTEGDLLRPGARSGLGWTALGLKLAQMLDFFSLAPGNLQESMVQRIQDFQLSEGEHRGYFHDVTLLRAVDKWRPFRRRLDYDARRAETRQAVVAIKGSGADPLYPLDFMFDDADSILEFVQQLPWDQNPWHCASHCSHLMVFLRTNSVVFGQRRAEEELLPVLLEAMEGLYRPEIGSWYAGNPPEYQKINAAMKAYSGFDFLGLPVPGAETMLDYALDAAIEAGACNHVDLLYVLHVASKATDHRRAEVNRLAYEALELVRGHIRPDGGLCYRPEGTQRHYYGMKVSKGRQGIGDLHGTKLFTWSLALAADLLGWRDELGWGLPVT